MMGGARTRGGRVTPRAWLVSDLVGPAGVLERVRSVDGAIMRPRRLHGAPAPVSALRSGKAGGLRWVMTPGPRLAAASVGRWRAGVLARWAGAVRPGLLAAARGPAKLGERARPAGGKSRLGRSVAWAAMLAPPLFSFFVFLFFSFV